MRRQPSGRRASQHHRAKAPAVLAAVLILLVATGLGSGPAAAQAPDGGDDGAAEADALLSDGAEVYSQICSSCHQPGGAGLPGTFPPLLDNPNVADAAYVRQVVNEGRQGQITVLGQTYDGVMPPFSTLGDDDIEAVIAYVQSGFAAPAASEEEFAAQPTGPVAGTELPYLANAGAIVAYLLAACVAGLVLAPRLIGTTDRLHLPWLDAALKTAVIVAGIVFLVVVVPNWALQTSTVSKLSRPGQDVIGLGLWGGGLVACLWALWYAHRDSRI
jgi:mono/diheme cytochrome c family protein